MLYLVYCRYGGPGAGDVGGDGPQIVRSRFSRSSSSLEQVPEELGPVGTYQETELMPDPTCNVRRARYTVTMYSAYTRCSIKKITYFRL